LTTQRQLLDTLDSVVNQRVTVPTNPYGGQCVALIDNILQYQGLYDLNFSYLNAINGLNRASALRLKVTYFNGYNNPPVGSVFVSDCSPYHQFGHIGFVVAEHADGTVTTIEQNIDGNADALYNGGWVRKVRRNLSDDGTFSYVDWNAPSQRMVGWFELPFTPDPTAPQQESTKKRGTKDMLVMRSHSGKQGYFGVVGDTVFGIGHIETVQSLINAGAAEISIHDDDFNRIVGQLNSDLKILGSIEKNTNS
jgi:putative phage-associated cell wall hydrolase